MATWEYDGPLQELVGRSHQLLRDKKLAYPFICTAETKKLQEQRERVNFYTNNIPEEVLRVGNNNGPAMIEHFVSQAQMQVEYIEQ